MSLQKSVIGIVKRQLRDKGLVFVIELVRVLRETIEDFVARL